MRKSVYKPALTQHRTKIISHLKTFITAASLHDVARALGFTPKSLSYILYIKPDAKKYHHFEIPKRSGEMRTISAPHPELMKLQRRLSDLLQNCIEEIDKAHEMKSSLSHGFKRKHSIITNATVHRNKRYVFNIDLENFFGTINFGRVRGFFIKNRNFNLNEKAATVIAQIACHNNALPQGSPCSPVISNLVAHILDIYLAKLAHKTGCHYSRYADDLTFSTNKPDFPSKIAKLTDGKEFHWKVGSELERIISKAGFSINPSKTRMQLEDSRQDVTGLVVNKKVNTRVEYRHTARAMTHRLRQTGAFQKEVRTLDADGNLEVTMVDGTLNQLNGILSFIDSVGHHNSKKLKIPHRKKGQKSIDRLDAKDNVYRNFLLYKDFFAATEPVVICEGKTDNIYIKAALRRLYASFPQLAEKKKGKSAELLIKLFRYTNTTDRLLDLAGGSGDLSNFIHSYIKECTKIKAPGLVHPIIILIDNDDGAKGIFGSINTLTKKKPVRTEPFYYLGQNLYVVPTPMNKAGQDTMIEDFFEPGLKSLKINGKTLNLSSKGFNNKTEYGKIVFAEQIVNKGQAHINFNGFIPILERLKDVVEHYKKITAT